MPREPRKPDEYIVHLKLEGGHEVHIRFNTIEEVKTWYASQFKAKANEDDLLPLPVKADLNEILLVRPKRVSAIHVEPNFSSSVEMF
ncbi:hypothetical protein TUMEXPCC7403_11090 [Tumidithrix helvetica PCC 7403]|uniref:Uncharacterized protein n=1 Tax=Tumidithrix elongata BACA0141 TaxID=2716417 RepID=A0AAW9PRQ0_9CYAN|nr:hypothetical protein [Tumidithrix elongata RA019]